MIEKMIITINHAPKLTEEGFEAICRAISIHLAGRTYPDTKEIGFVGVSRSFGHNVPDVVIGFDTASNQYFISREPASALQVAKAVDKVMQQLGLSYEVHLRYGINDFVANDEDVEALRLALTPPEER